MRGTVKWQVQEVYKTISAIGQSKHADKAAARDNGARTWAELGRELRIYSYATADTYRAVWRDLLTYTHQNFQMKDIEKLNGEYVRAFLEHKIENNVAKSTFSNYSAALSKLEIALNTYSSQNGKDNTYNFRTDIKEVREIAQQTLAKFEGSRAYNNPSSIISSMNSDAYSQRYALVATIQHQSGARVHEANNIREHQLKGFVTDKVTGETRGAIQVSGKGGKTRDLLVSKDTYSRVASYIEREGKFTFAENTYREMLKQAAHTSEQKYQGTHGLRWSFARERLSTIKGAGYSREDALKAVSQELGHERTDITNHYLR